MPTLSAMHCYSLAALTVLLVVVLSSPLASSDARISLATNVSTSVSWTSGRRQIHSHSQSPVIAERFLNGISRSRPTSTDLIVDFHSTETSSFLSSAFVSQKSSKVNDNKGHVSAQDFHSPAQANSLSPTLSTTAVPLPVPTGELITTPTASPSSGCTMTVMGDLRNPCLRSPVRTSTVTKYTAVDCHGCTSIYVVEHKWHCPAVITTAGSFTASIPFTLTTTMCASTSALSDLGWVTQASALTIGTHRQLQSSATF